MRRRTAGRSRALVTMLLALASDGPWVRSTETVAHRYRRGPVVIPATGLLPFCSERGGRWPQAPRRRRQRDGVGGPLCQLRPGPPVGAHAPGGPGAAAHGARGRPEDGLRRCHPLILEEQTRQVARAGPERVGAGSGPGWPSVARLRERPVHADPPLALNQTSGGHGAQPNGGRCRAPQSEVEPGRRGPAPRRAHRVGQERRFPSAGG